MKKFFIIWHMSLLFLVACEKDGAIINNDDQTRVEEELPMLINPPRVYNSPQEVNCNKNGQLLRLRLSCQQFITGL